MANAEKGRLLAREIRRLVEHGFDVRDFLIDAACHSVPQRRKRLFLLALPKNTLADETVVFAHR